MKANIHPQYHHDARVKCACGNSWITGSTVAEINIEICSNCHPFYTGKEKVIDTRGRIDRFKKRASMVQESVKAKTTGKKTAKTRVPKGKIR